MYPVSTDFTNKILVDGREMKAKTLINGVLADDDVVSISIERSTQLQNQIIGNAVSAKCTLVINNPANYQLTKDTVVDIGIGMLTTELVPYPYFFIEEAPIDKVSKQATITCYDALSKKAFLNPPASYTFPCTIRSFLQQLATQIGVGLNVKPFPLDSFVLETFPNFKGDESIRECIMKIAEACCSNAIIDCFCRGSVFNLALDSNTYQTQNFSGTNQIIINETRNYKLTSLEVKGKATQTGTPAPNEVITNKTPYNTTTWAEWVAGSVPLTKSATGLEFTGDGVNYPTAYINTSLKTSTKYLILLNIVSNNTNTNLSISTYLTGNSTYLANPNVTGNIKSIITTQATIATNRLRFEVNIPANGLKMKIKDVRVFELPVGSKIEADANALTADQLNAKYPFATTLNMNYAIEPVPFNGNLQISDSIGLKQTINLGTAYGLPNGVCDRFYLSGGHLYKEQKVKGVTGQSGTTWTFADAKDNSAFWANQIPNGVLVGKALTSATSLTGLNVWYELSTPIVTDLGAVDIATYSPQTTLQLSDTSGGMTTTANILTEGWATNLYGSLVVNPGELEYTTTAANVSARIETATDFQAIAGHLYFVRYNITSPRASSTNITLGSNIKAECILTPNVSKTNYFTIQLDGSVPLKFYIDLNASLQVGDKVKISDLIIIDLSEHNLTHLNADQINEKLLEYFNHTYELGNGELEIKPLKQTLIGSYEGDVYKELDVGAKFGPINSVSLFDTTLDDVIVSEDETSIATNGKTQIIIADNPIIDNYREAVVPTLLSAINGFYFYDCKLQWFGNPAIDVGDYMAIKDLDGNTINTICAIEKAEFSGGFFVEMECTPPTVQEAQSNNGSMSKALKSALIKIDRANAQIELKASQEDVDGIKESSILLDENGILQQVVNGDLISSINQSAEEVKIEANKISLLGEANIPDLSFAKMKGGTVKLGTVEDEEGTYEAELELRDELSEIIATLNKYGVNIKKGSFAVGNGIAGVAINEGDDGQIRFAPDFYGPTSASLGLEGTQQLVLRIPLGSFAIHCQSISYEAPEVFLDGNVKVNDYQVITAGNIGDYLDGGGPDMGLSNITTIDLPVDGSGQAWSSSAFSYDWNGVTHYESENYWYANGMAFNTHGAWPEYAYAYIDESSGNINYGSVSQYPPSKYIWMVILNGPPGTNYVENVYPNPSGY